jgi:hypothetical protein
VPLQRFFPKKQARWNKDEEAHDLLREAQAVVAAKARPEK